MAKKTTKQKMGPLGNPLGNPLGFFNSLKGKAKPELKQNLKKAQDGGVNYNDYLKAKNTNLNHYTVADVQDNINHWNNRIARNKEFYNEIGPAGPGQVKAPQNNDMENRMIRLHTEQLPGAKERDNAEKTIRQWQNENPVGTLPLKPVVSVQRKGGVIKMKNGGNTKTIINKKNSTVKSKKK